MDNHYHLVIELRQAHLRRAVQLLNLSYSVWFNRRHSRNGHLFKGRFKSVLFDETASALEVSRYAHLNPGRVGQLSLGKSDRAARKAAADGVPKVAQVEERLKKLRGDRWSSYRSYPAKDIDAIQCLLNYATSLEAMIKRADRMDIFLRGRA